jgi:hypothetical protein
VWFRLSAVGRFINPLCELLSVPRTVMRLRSPLTLCDVGETGGALQFFPLINHLRSGNSLVLHRQLGVSCN